MGSSRFPGVGASSLCLSYPQELEMQARVHGLPTTSPSGMNMAELAQQVVKQELPSEEGPGEAREVLAARRDKQQNKTR